MGWTPFGPAEERGECDNTVEEVDAWREARCEDAEEWKVISDRAVTLFKCKDGVMAHGDIDGARFGPNLVAPLFGWNVGGSTSPRFSGSPYEFAFGIRNLGL